MGSEMSGTESGLVIALVMIIIAVLLSVLPNIPIWAPRVSVFIFVSGLLILLFILLRGLFIFIMSREK